MSAGVRGWYLGYSCFDGHIMREMYLQLGLVPAFRLGDKFWSLSSATQRGRAVVPSGPMWVRAGLPSELEAGFRPICAPGRFGWTICPLSTPGPRRIPRHWSRGRMSDTSGLRKFVHRSPSFHRDYLVDWARPLVHTYLITLVVGRRRKWAPLPSPL